METGILGRSTVRITPIIMGTWQAGKRMWVGIEDESSIRAIRAIGVSNFSGEQLEAACQYGRIDSLQPPYSLFWRQVEIDLMPYCIANEISILAYSSLAQGLLTGKFTSQVQLAEGDHRAKNKLFQGENYQRVQQAIFELEPIAKRHNCTLAQLTLAWLIAQPQTNAIAGARTPLQAVDNAKAGNIKLDNATLQEIDLIGRQVTDYLDDNPIMWDW